MRQHSHNPARRIAWLLALVTMLVAAALPAAAQGSQKSINVMTRNLYLGTGLNGLVGVPPASIPGAAAAAWGNVVATDFNARAEALADEIVASDSQVVGLQEVTWWRQGFPDTIYPPPGDFTPNANISVYNFQDALIAELAERGKTFTAASTSWNADVELPRYDPTSPFAGLGLPFWDTRLTDRDVILVRSDVAGDISNPQDGHYAAQLALPVGGGSAEFTRGWASVDVQLSGGTLRFFNTHLEVDGGPAGYFQELQGNEALDIIGDSPHPVVAVGDFNSDARGTTTATYGNLIAGGLSDVIGGTGPSTCCQNELLTNTASENGTRIDLILTKGPFKVNQVGIVGNTRFRNSPAPLWASDHAGVVASIGLK